MWQQEFTWFFAFFHQESCSAINLVVSQFSVLSLDSVYEKATQ
jgi:hypothetical protein